MAILACRPWQLVLSGDILIQKSFNSLVVFRYADEVIIAHSAEAFTHFATGSLRILEDAERTKRIFPTA